MQRTAGTAAVLVLAVAALVWATGARPVAAHANLLRSSPAQNAVLGEPPDRVIIWFTEPVEPQFSEIRVLTQDGERVDNAGTQSDPTEPTAVAVGLKPLARGTYTVAWRNLSRVDGHAARGSFVFSVGGPLSVQAPVQAAPPLLQTSADPWQRWLFLLGAVALAGGLVFELAVISPALGAADAGSPQGTAAQRLSDRLAPLLAAAFILIATGSFGQLVQQARLTSGETFFGALGSPLANVIADTAWGRLWLVRTTLFALAGVAVLKAVRARRPADEDEAPGLIGDSFFAPLALLLAIGGLAITTLMSHSAAVPRDVRGPAIASDFIHLVAAAAWTGGLVYLVLVAAPVLFRAPQGEDRRATLAAVIPRFSTIAFLSAGAVVITGLFLGWMHVTVPAAVRTPYGWALVAKVVLLAPLFALAFINSYVVRPKLAKDDAPARSLRRYVTAEAVLAALVLLAVGWLASLEPARQHASRTGIGEPGDPKFEAAAEGAVLRVSVSPAKPGYNLVVVRLSDRSGKAITNAAQVRARLVYRGEDLGSEFVSAVDQGQGVWTANGLPANVAGNWQAEVVVVRPDAFDARAAFEFEVRANAVLTDRIRPTRDATFALLGAETALLGLLAVAAAAQMRRTASRAALSLAGPGAVGIIAGVALAVATLAARPGSASAQLNPVLPTQASIDRGLALYAATCASCHGDAGRGDGPGAAALTRKPSDLIVHVPLHPDRRLFEFIRDGVPQRGMPGRGGELSEPQMWDLVNYLRALAESR